MQKLIHGDKVPFVQITNKMLCDKNLSLKAKGLLAYMLSKPNDWQFYIAAMASELRENKDTIGRILNELIESKYVERKELREDGSKFAGYEYTVLQLPRTENPYLDSSDTENGDIQIKKVQTRNTRTYIKHPKLGVPMNEVRYDSLVKEYSRAVVDDAIESRIDWEAAKGKKPAKDYAAAAATWIKNSSRYNPKTSAEKSAEELISMLREG